jgi:aminoglycoside/choline kinase family phosphotransferase
MALPKTVEDISAAWLTEALSRRHPGLVVASARHDDVIAGTGTKVTVDVEFNDVGRAAGIPGRLLVKGAFSGHQYTEIVSPLYVREARFFRDIAPGMTINVPRCEFAEFEPDSGQGVVVLEDLRLRGVTFGRATEPVAAEMAAAMLTLLAQLHAATWGRADIHDFGVWPDFLPSLLNRDDPNAYWSAPSWTASMRKPQAAAVPERWRDYDVLERAVRAMWATHETGPRCLVHGDPHLGNWFYTSDDRPGLLDWQMTMAGPWATDFTEFLVSALTIEARRAHERDLLTHYLDQLRVHGADAPSFEQAWLAYRQNVPYSVLWAAIPEEMQPVDINTAATERASAAADDLDTLGSLGIS